MDPLRFVTMTKRTSARRAKQKRRSNISQALPVWTCHARDLWLLELPGGTRATVERQATRTWAIYCQGRLIACGIPHLNAAKRIAVHEAATPAVRGQHSVPA